MIINKKRFVGKPSKPLTIYIKMVGATGLEPATSWSRILIADKILHNMKYYMTMERL